MKRFVFSLLAITGMMGSLNAQTLIIDYSEHTRENTASIHMIESKLPIETEEFDDIKAAKTKLVRTIENYHTDGYFVRSSNVTTHKSGRGYHYHYQYILQKANLRAQGAMGERGNTSPEDRRDMQRIMNMKRERDGAGARSGTALGGGQEEGRVRINSDTQNDAMLEERERILKDGEGQVKLIKQPDPVE